MDLSENAWNSRYINNDIGWDLGKVSPPLKNYFDQLEDKKIKILIPGAGNAYEAEYLFNQGFRNVFVIDLSKTALDNFKKRVPDFPTSQLLHGNFFDINISFNLIIEQTFFCAINPNLRQQYSIKMHQILKTNGKLVGLLFNASLFSNRPPFGGSKKEYVSYFKPYFEMKTFENCYNSIKSRHGKELFIQLIKK
ncbi:methyltransferase domain-containing protein [Polaribacter aestuariivivens]|uniref:Methyltransferase domain-containing protein n=1 Tax=Polaribacter aestuariivivens TaxID=2304626 RepID=A0A5S3N5M2_9FLAO|nr:methyltransferase domain-containing protein [Polaribacter aestuariivivens]TMM30583.1 methyltransferase domain-containing protein [Polaribacter aestuariivivens]